MKNYRERPTAIPASPSTKKRACTSTSPATTTPSSAASPRPTQPALSAAEWVPGSDTSQTLNRYAYVENNPLKFTDPSGHGWFSSVWKSIKGFIGTIVTVALTPLVGPLAASIIGSAIGTLVNGGTWKSFAIGVGIGIAAGAIASGLGSVMNGGGFWAGAGSYLAGGPSIAVLVGDFAAGAITGAVEGAISSAVYGGNWGQNMLEGAKDGLISAAKLAVGKLQFVVGMKETLMLLGKGIMNKVGTLFDKPHLVPRVRVCRIYPGSVNPDTGVEDKFGHYWTEIDLNGDGIYDEGWGFWPKKGSYNDLRKEAGFGTVDGAVNSGRLNDPHLGDTPDHIVRYDVYSTKSTVEVINSIREFATSYDRRYGVVFGDIIFNGESCQTFQREWLIKDNLHIKRTK